MLHSFRLQFDTTDLILLLFVCAVPFLSLTTTSVAAAQQLVAPFLQQQQTLSLPQNVLCGTYNDVVFRNSSGTLPSLALFPDSSSSRVVLVVDDDDDDDFSRGNASEEANTWRADSVRRKRKKKLNKHKHAKRRKLNRHRR